MPWRLKKRKNKQYVLDAYALLAFLEAEPGGEVVQELLQAADNIFFISVINLGEVYYTLWRERGKEAADLFALELCQFDNIVVIDANWERVRMAAQFKAGGGLSYADCFAAALAVEKNAPVLTGDRELARIADKIKIIWLDRKS